MDIVVDGIIFGLQKSGGISRCWADLLLQLDKSSYRTTLLIPSNTNVEWKELSPKLKNLKIMKRKRFRWGRSSMWQERLYLTLIYNLLRPHIWHASYYVGFPWASCHRLISYHDMIPEKIKRVNQYDHFFKYATLKQASGIFSPSHSAAQDLKEYWPNFFNKTIVIPHGFSPQSTQTIESPFPYFLYLGKRGSYKCFAPTVDALLKDPRFQAYHVVAIGGEEIPEQSHPRIHYLGTLPHPEVRGWIQKAALLLMPSRYEGFGLPLLEAFSLGTPVLARNTSSIPEITGPGYPLINNDNEYTTIIAQLLAEREHWIEYGYQRASLFTNSLCWEKYQNAYALLLRCDNTNSLNALSTSK